MRNGQMVYPRCRQTGRHKSMTQTAITISVIIPSFNRRNLLPRALDSVLQQTRPADEIIVVDDGSTDGTAAMLASRYPQVTLLQQNNGGVSKARNRGIHHASGDWIALLDSDDTWLPQKLQQQVTVIQQQPDSVLCHSDEIWIRRGKRVNPMHKHRKQGGNIFQHCLPLCVISPSASLIRRQILIELGLFDEALPACEDYDLWLRLCALYPVLYLDEPLITKYGGHDDQLSRRYWGMDRFRIQALCKIIDHGQLQPDDAQAAHAMLVEKCRIMAQGANKRGNQLLAQRYEQLPLQYFPAATSTSSTGKTNSA